MWCSSKTDSTVPLNSTQFVHFTSVFQFYGFTLLATAVFSERDLIEKTLYTTSPKTNSKQTKLPTSATLSPTIIIYTIDLEQQMHFAGNTMLSGLLL